MKHPRLRTIGFIRSAGIVCFIFVYLLLSGIASGQAPLFETSLIENRLIKQLNLTRSDLKPLRPLIEWESDDLLLLYEYYSDQRDLEFLSLWNAVRSRQTRRRDRRFEKLTGRQKKALSFARFEIGRGILEQWLDDHVQTLADLLELDLIQFKYLQKVFDLEHLERLEILRKEACGPARLDTLWQRLTDQRERKVQHILSESQLRIYHQLAISPRLIAVNSRIENY